MLTKEAQSERREREKLSKFFSPQPEKKAKSKTSPKQQRVVYKKSPHNVLCVVLFQVFFAPPSTSSVSSESYIDFFLYTYWSSSCAPLTRAIGIPCEIVIKWLTCFDYTKHTSESDCNRTLSAARCQVDVSARSTHFSPVFAQLHQSRVRNRETCRS